MTEHEPVGSGPDVWNSGITGIADQFHQPRKIEQWLTAGKGDGLNPPAGGRVDDSLDRVGCQGRPGEGFRGAHTALGAAGIAAIGDLDHHLSGNTVVKNGSENLAQRIHFLFGIEAA
jgi:hypothetical protein